MERLQQNAQAMGISLTQAQLNKFESYYQEMLAWNAKTNLTRITERDEVISKHFLDSLSCLLAVPELPQQVIDVGAGAGFPGLALKIAQPHIHLTLLEATGKKTAFLNHVVAQLKLDKVTVLHNRAETAGHLPAHRACYDLAVARAVAPLRVLAEYMLPLLKINGLMLAQKGSAPTAEVAEAKNALKILGGAAPKVQSIAVSGLLAKRHLILIKKIRKTPVSYPRQPGMPAKKPL